MASVPETFQLKIRLLGISPMIWRRVLVSPSITLRELHGVLQVAMGWDGIHLFQFNIRAVDYGSLELHAANPNIALSGFGFRRNDRFAYIYDMGNYWNHEVRVEAVMDADPKKTYPVCTGGAGACPPEECGGPLVLGIDGRVGDRNVTQVDELLSNLVFEGCWSCGDLVGVCGFDSVFERDACDDFREVVKAA